jgi:4-carboxymuconolactone decarboxylase
MTRIADVDSGRLTADQKRISNLLTLGPRGGVGGPFRVFLHRPLLAETAQSLGLYLRYGSALPPRLIELVILFVTREWKSEYPWYAHKSMAREAGIADHVIESIRTHCPPDFEFPDEAILFVMLEELHCDRRVSEDTYHRAVDLIGEAGVIDAIALAGYYTLVSMTINVFEIGLPDGQDAELQHSSSDR